MARLVLTLSMAFLVLVFLVIRVLSVKPTSMNALPILARTEALAQTVSIASLALAYLVLLGLSVMAIMMSVRFVLSLFYPLSVYCVYLFLLS
jgi:hypothetical protein